MREPVRIKIADAFGATPYPGDDAIVADVDERDPEGMALASSFRGRRWQDVSAAMVHAHKSDLPLFSPAGFHYYLPAYMLACVDHADEIDVAYDSTLFNLTPPRPRRGWRWDWFEARARLFDEPQRDAVRWFLELVQRYELDDWASAGKRPPNDRVGPALAYWRPE